MDSGHVEESIKHSISKNGFPKKRVKLPFKPIFDCCKQNNTSLAEVLENLSKENISGKIKGDYIEFGSSLDADHGNSNTFQAGEPGSADGDNLQKSAMDMLSRMTPEQIADLRRMAEGLSEEEKKSIMGMMGEQNKPPS